jgi:hypothetical protein
MAEPVVKFVLRNGSKVAFAGPDNSIASYSGETNPEDSPLTRSKLVQPNEPRMTAIPDEPISGKLSEKLEPVIAATEEIASQVHKIFSTGNISITFGISISEGMDLVIARGQGNASLSVTVSWPPKPEDQDAQTSEQ